MDDIIFCQRCLYASTHPLGLVLDDDGICSGCRIHEEKDRLDWAERFERLKRLVAPYRGRGAGTYDCIVPVTGGQDSYFILHVVKNLLGLNPLVVAYNKYFNTALGIRNLANLRIKFNVDCLYQNVNPEAVKRITRASLRRFGSIYWPILAGHTVFPVQTAVAYRVPLIIWGAHQGLEQVGMFSHEHEVEMTRRYRKDHDLFGCEADNLLDHFDTLSEDDIWQYRYPDDAKLDAVGVRGIYLGNFLRWDPKAQHEEMVRLYDYRGARFTRTFDTYDFVDCYNYMDLHDHLKLIKHGFSKVTDHASREIRHGRLARQQGLALVRHHEQQALRFMPRFCEWLGVTERSLHFVIDLHRNPRFWTETEFGQFTFKGWSTRHDALGDADGAETASAELDFQVHDTLERGGPANYIIFGKGFP